MGTMAHVAFTTLLTVCLIGNVFAQRTANADLVLLNGKILTADQDGPFGFTIAGAVAISDGEIVAVGDDATVTKFAGTETRKIDLKGKTVIPGLIDTHSHVHEYAMSHYGRHLREEVSLSGNNKAEVLARLKEVALKTKQGEWIIARAPFRDAVVLPMFYSGQITRFDLDQVAPDHPVAVLLTVASGYYMVNTKALNTLLKRYPQGLPGMAKNAKGDFTGYLKGIAALTVDYEIIPAFSPEVVAPIYKREMEEWAAMGVTTVSTRLDPASLSTYHLLDTRDEMPVRLAYSSEVANEVLNPEAVIARLGNILGAGSPKLWLMGLSPQNIDGVPSMGKACFHKAYPREHKDFQLWRYQLFGPHGECTLTDPDFRDRELVLAAAKYGLRVTGMHVAGDKSLDQFLELVEEAGKDLPAGVSGLRFAVDHCRFVNQQQAQRGQKLGILFSCAPKYVHSGSKGDIGAIGAIYGDEVAADVVVPARRLIDAGARTVMEMDEHGRYPFLDIEVLVTRKDQDGQVWGPHQRIDRREALYMFTRWAAEYVLKEKTLGSIEPAKWADLVVLDRDFLSVADEEISDLNVLMTVVGGHIVYTHSDFAEKEALPQVGFRENAKWRRN